MTETITPAKSTPITAETQTNAHSRSIPEVAVFALFAIIFMLCYLPVITATYGCGDDYLWVMGALKHDMQHMQLLQFVQGRPLMALLFTCGFSPMTNIGDLRYLRLFSILTVAVLAYSLYRTTVSAGHNRAAAFLLPIVICTMPPFQVYVSWAATAFYALASVIAGGSYYFANRCYEAKKAISKYSCAAVSIVLFLMSLTIFQPSAMFFWVFVAIKLFKPNEKLTESRKRFIWYLGISVVAMVLGYLVCHFGKLLYSSACPLPHQRSHLTSDLWAKLIWFCQQPLSSTLNFGRLNISPKQSIEVAIAVAVGMFLYLRSKLTERIQFFILALVLVPLSYLPNLVIEENWASYRTECALAALIVLYAFLALLGYRQILLRSVREPVISALIGACAVASVAVAFYNVSVYFAVPNQLEFEVLQGQLNRDTGDKRSFSDVAFKEDLLAPAKYFEFGQPSSSMGFLAESMDYLLRR